MREAPSLRIVAGLLKDGVSVGACDPVAQEQARTLIPELIFAANPHKAAEGADALVIVTDWDEYRALDLRRMASAMDGNVLVDFQIVYKAEEAVRAGLTYAGIGRQPVTAPRQVWPNLAA